MSKGSFAVVLLVFLAAGTQEAQDPVYVDTEISGVVLGDDSAGRLFVERVGASVSEERFGIRTFQYLNDNETQILELFTHPGGLRHEFLEYRVRALDGAESRNASVLEVARFESGRGVHLGLNVGELVEVLGQEHEREEQADTLRLVFRCTSARACPVLGRLNMPEYLARYTFVNGILTEFEAGYPMP